MNSGAFDNIQGLCGNFDGMTNNDFVGQDNIPALSLASAAKSWADSLCPDTVPDVEDKCIEVRTVALVDFSPNFLSSCDSQFCCSVVVVHLIV